MKVLILLSICVSFIIGSTAFSRQTKEECANATDVSSVSLGDKGHKRIKTYRPRTNGVSKAGKARNE